ncbi:MAG: pseudouridine synthase [Sphingobacteriaceae bacterium]|nr:pseudouridine synthase [Sphingobacteriaceae bacterium]
MVSQFVSSHKLRLLCDLEYDFPEGTNAVGRLDNDSEGLLILTTDKSLVGKLMHPDKKRSKRYVVQVEKVITEDKLNILRNGMDILVKGKGTYHTKECEVNVIEKPSYLPERGHTFREGLPQSWLEFVLKEGKNRQIRKMCSGVRHDCKRLIRTHIEDLDIIGFKAGEVREMGQEELFKKLNL